MGRFWKCIKKLEGMCLQHLFSKNNGGKFSIIAKNEGLDTVNSFPTAVHVDGRTGVVVRIQMRDDRLVGR